MTTMTTDRDWIEINTDRLIRRAKRSQFSAEIFADAREIHRREAVVMDVALMISLRYWEGNPITGEVRGI